MSKVFVLGSLNIDLTISSERFPEKGETIIGKNFMITSGGKGGNQAVACGKQGVETIMLGSIGKDSFSKILKDNLLEFGVNCNHLQEIDNINCGLASIWVCDNDNRIIISQGANLFHNVDEIVEILKKESFAGDILISQLEIPLEVVEKVFVEAKLLGLRTILNPAPAAEISDLLYQNIDFIIPNETEIKLLTNIEPTDEKNIIEAAKVLINKGVGAVILTIGEKGSYYLDRNMIFSVDAYKVDVVDTTAAGDTFIGVFASEIIRGKILRQAMKRANAAASLTIQRVGAQISIPSYDEVDDFVKGYEE